MALEEGADFLGNFGVDRSIAAEVFFETGHGALPVPGGEQGRRIGQVTASAFSLVAGGCAGGERQAVGEGGEGAAEQGDEGKPFHLSVPRP